MSSLTSARLRYIATERRIAIGAAKPVPRGFSAPRVAITALIGALLVVAGAVLLGVA